MSELDRDLEAFREATEPDAGRLARIRAGRAVGRPVWPWMAGVALAAAALGTVGVVGLSDKPTTREPVVEVPEQALTVAFDGRGGTTSLGPHVEVDAQGVGVASGTGSDLALRWDAGQLDVRVAPDRGVELAVETPEGVVRVVGTVFTVRRDALGTSVSVARGRVLADCAVGDPRELSARESVTCLPVDAPGWLRRVAALQQAGDFLQVLDGVDRGLTHEVSGPVALELRLHRVVAYGALDRTEQALAELAALTDDFPEASDRIAATRSRLEAP